MAGGSVEPKMKNPRRVAAGRLNGPKRRPWTPEELQRLSQQCLEQKPWLVSTGPRTEEGKQRSAVNGSLRQPDPNSLRQLRASLTDVGDMIAMMAQLRRSLGGREAR